jgi:hypothetical protein
MSSLIKIEKVLEISAIYKMEKRGCQYFYVISVIYVTLCPFVGKKMPPDFRIDLKCRMLALRTI